MKLCPKGHPITGRNIAWGISHGERFRRCRLCWNAYHVKYRKRIKRRRRRATRGKR